uniref:Nudix hydrolase domain-containing protein n=1 Tax=Eutreptiella gymnastica TaxID=73025 RepID=A0A7S1N1G6_9EUGL|mmetsp:Transcript_105115/g.181271  ORF Transcript_105115/g.181271 Transcript_105115/m.181271 type:complete len:258 (+) Transcript_105115:44-817(+)
MHETTVALHGQQVPLFLCSELALPGDTLDKVAHCKGFRDWVARTDAQKVYTVEDVEVQHVDFFGPHVGTIKLKVSVKVGMGPTTTSIFELKGGNAGVLAVLDHQGRQYTVLSMQPRVPIANFSLLEIPIGLIDSSGKFAGKAAQEFREELDLVLTKENLVDMTTLAYNGKFSGVFQSPGHTDVHNALYLFRDSVTTAQLASFKERTEEEEGDIIDLKLVPLKAVWKATSDAKTLAAVALFSALQAEGKLPESTVSPS